MKQASVSISRNGRARISSTSHQIQLLHCCFAVNTWLKGEVRRVVCAYALMQESVHVTLQSCHATITWSFQWRVAFLRFSRLHNDALVTFLKRLTLKCFFQTQRCAGTFCSFTCKRLAETLQNDSVFLWTYNRPCARSQRVKFVVRMRSKWIDPVAYEVIKKDFFTCVVYSSDA